MKPSPLTRSLILRGRSALGVLLLTTLGLFALSCDLLEEPEDPCQPRGAFALEPAGLSRGSGCDCSHLDHERFLSDGSVIRLVHEWNGNYCEVARRIPVS